MVALCVCVWGRLSGVILIQTRYLAQAGLELRILLPECLLYICHLTNHRHLQVGGIKESASTDGKGPFSLGTGLNPHHRLSFPNYERQQPPGKTVRGRASWAHTWEASTWQCRSRRTTLSSRQPRLQNEPRSLNNTLRKVPTWFPMIARPRGGRKEAEKSSSSSRKPSRLDLGRKQAEHPASFCACVLGAPTTRHPISGSAFPPAGPPRPEPPAQRAPQPGSARATAVPTSSPGTGSVACR